MILKGQVEDAMVYTLTYFCVGYNNGSKAYFMKNYSKYTKSFQLKRVAKKDLAWFIPNVPSPILGFDILTWITGDDFPIYHTFRDKRLPLICDTETDSDLNLNIAKKEWHL